MKSISGRGGAIVNVEIEAQKAPVCLSIGCCFNAAGPFVLYHLPILTRKYGDCSEHWGKALSVCYLRVTPLQRSFACAE